MSARPIAALLLPAITAAPLAAGAATGLRLPAPVYRTVAVAAGGRIYVLGGHDSAGGTTSTVDVFDPASGSSKRAGTLALPTHGSAAATLHGRILVFGSAANSVHDVEQQFLPARGRRSSARRAGRRSGQPSWG